MDMILGVWMLNDHLPSPSNDVAEQIEMSALIDWDTERLDLNKMFSSGIPICLNPHKRHQKMIV